MNMRKTTGLFVLSLSAALTVGLLGCDKPKGTGGSTPAPSTTTAPGGSASTATSPAKPNAAPTAAPGTTVNSSGQAAPPGMTSGAGDGRN